MNKSIAFFICPRRLFSLKFSRNPEGDSRSSLKWKKMASQMADDETI